MNIIKTPFYIVPHADDWQLFMQPNAYNDIQTGKRVVFIMVTAGDAGLGEQYWKAREKGCVNSILYCLATSGDCVVTNGVKTLLNESITYTSINNVIIYFLRLPDGNIDGSGFAANGSQSLYNLKFNNQRALNKLDQRSGYENWQEIANILNAIICEECKNDDVIIHYLNPDTSININDHNDHICVGNIIQQMPIIEKCDRFLYRGYSNNQSLDNLSESESFWKTGMFAAYEKTVYEMAGYSTIKEDPIKYVQWCSCKNDYIRINRLSE